MLYFVCIFIGILIGFGLTMVILNLTSKGSILIDMRSNPEKWIYQFDFKKDPADLVNNRIIIMTINKNAKLSSRE